MTTIFCTGGAGFIGSNFCRYWLSTHPDDTVINYDLLTYAGNLASLADVEEEYGDRYLFVQGDIANLPDEDGVVFNTPLAPGQAATVTACVAIASRIVGNSLRSISRAIASGARSIDTVALPPSSLWL